MDPLVRQVGLTGHIDPGPGRLITSVVRAGVWFVKVFAHQIRDMSAQAATAAAAAAWAAAAAERS